MKKEKNFFWPTVMLIIFSTLFALFAAEWGYRILLKVHVLKLPTSTAYRMSPSPHTAFDEKYGDHNLPNNENWMFMVDNNQLVGGARIYKSNADGLDGKTTYAEYKKADTKILVFGDSFTHWNQDSVTWPDLLQDNLNKNAAKKTAVINYARGAYGLTQMLDLAADKIYEDKPDLVVIAVIGDDFSRARWWDKVVMKDGIPRWMLSSNKDNFLDYKYAGDYALVIPEATPQWYHDLFKSGKRTDAVIEKATANYNKIKLGVDSALKQIPLFRWDHSFLYSKITTGSPFNYHDHLPRIAITDYSQDPRTKNDIEKIKAAGVPIVLVYLPLMTEYKSHTILTTYEPKKGQHKALMNSLEGMLGTNFYQLQKEYKGVVPNKIDLAPYDMHPNITGLHLYADIIAPIVQAKLPAAKK